MTTIHLALSGAQAQATVDGLITAGTAGISVEITWDSAWEGLSKTLICQSSFGVQAVPVNGHSAVVPAGILQLAPHARNELFIGVEGHSDDREQVLPSTLAYCGKILAGAVSPMETGCFPISSQNPPQSLQWHQCPPLSRRFLAEVEYDPADPTDSRIENYAPAAPGASNCKPIGYAVENKTFQNQVPGVATEFISGSSYGTITPLDPLRWLNTPDAPNVRDLGGWACDGGTVKYGLLFRGGEPTANDRAVLVEECGVRHDLNLRGSDEATWESSPLGKDIRFTRAAGTNWYTATVNDQWKTNIRCVFDAVTHKEPVYFHCAAGADRTATLACVLEGLLGMSRSDIDKDYELTCFSTGAATDALARRRNEEEWKGLVNQISAFDGDTFREQCISFVLALGFSITEINLYRKAMIAGTPEEVTKPEPPSASGYTNLLPAAIGSDGTVLRNKSGEALGYADGCYLSGNATNVWQNMTYAGDDSTHFLTGFIPYTIEQAQQGVPIYVSGVTLDSANGHTRMAGYNSYDASAYHDPVKFSSGKITVEQIREGYYKLVPTASFVSTMTASNVASNFQYVRFSFGGSGNGVILSVGNPVS